MFEHFPPIYFHFVRHRLCQWQPQIITAVNAATNQNHRYSEFTPPHKKTKKNLTMSGQRDPHPVTRYDHLTHRLHHKTDSFHPFLSKVKCKKKLYLQKKTWNLRQNIINKNWKRGKNMNHNRVDAPKTTLTQLVQKIYRCIYVYVSIYILYICFSTKKQVYSLYE